jgi:hypothetical protein
MPMLRFPIKVELSDDILFFLRPVPADNADILLYVEDQIAELLFADESVVDVMYRFSESSDGVLIAVGRIKTLGQQKPLSQNRGCRRVPAAIGLWFMARSAMKQDMPPVFVYGEHGGRWYLVFADVKQVYRVFRLAALPGSAQEIVLAVDKVRENGDGKNGPCVLFTVAALPETLLRELRSRSIEIQTVAVKEPPEYDRALLDEWDFRLPQEVEAQELAVQKFRMVKACIATVAGIAGLWLLLFVAGLAADRMERRSADEWRRLQSSLKEIGYLQKETRSLVTEITLCKKLSERRTARASVLQGVVSSRSPDIVLDELKIGDRKHAGGKDARGGGPDELLLKGYSNDNREITAWMESLAKSSVFSSVELLSLEKKGAAYHFQIKCGLAVGRNQGPS